MVRGALVLGSVVGALAVSAAPAVAAPGSTVTATGTGQARVVPANRHSNASIAAAVERARERSIAGAVTQANKLALMYAGATGLTLGPVMSVTDVQTNGPGPFVFFGPFGPGRYCGTVRRFHVVIANGRKRFVPGRRHRVCNVPPFAYTSLTVTYQAS